MKARYQPGTATTLLPLLAIGIIVLLQVIAYRLPVRFDLTPQRLHSLAEKSRNVLAALDGSTLEVIAFYPDDDYFRDRARDLLEEYRVAYSSFQYRIVDPARNPALVERYNVGSNATLVLRYRGREATVIGRDEESITNAIFRLADGRPRIVYFTTGNGEQSIQGGYSLLAEALRGELYEIREILPARESAIPADAHLLVVAGPRAVFSTYELGLIERYIGEGGSVLFMLDPFRDGGFAPFMAQHGLQLYLDTVVDEQSRMMGGDTLFPIVSDYGNHPAVRSLDLMTLFPGVRSIGVDSAAGAGWDIRPIARTAPESWAEVDLDALARGETRFDRGIDRPGPLTIAVAAEREGGPTAQRGRFVLFGDSDFASNEFIGLGGNRDLILSTIAWLTNEPNLIGIRSRDPDHTPAILTQTQTRRLFWLANVLLPLSFLIAGIGVFLFGRWKQ